MQKPFSVFNLPMQSNYCDYSIFNNIFQLLFKTAKR